MSQSMCKITSLAMGLCFAGQALADTASRLEKFVGYAIVASKTIDSWVEEGKKEDGFTGCKQGRTIVFTDGTALKCNTYDYHYAYRPTAILLAKQIGIYGGQTLYDVKMIVEDEVFDMNSF